MHKNELQQIYLDTLYSIFFEEQEYIINIDKHPPKEINALLEKTKNKSGIILTAWNPRGAKTSIVNNKKNNIELSNELKNNNFIYYNALGKSNDVSWVSEESFFILDVNKEQAELLAVKYQQNAYLWLEKNKPAALIFSAVWES